MIIGPTDSGQCPYPGGSPKGAKAEDAVNGRWHDTPDMKDQEVIRQDNPTPIIEIYCCTRGRGKWCVCYNAGDGTNDTPKCLGPYWLASNKSEAKKKMKQLVMLAQVRMLPKVDV